MASCYMVIMSEMTNGELQENGAFENLLYYSSFRHGMGRSMLLCRLPMGAVNESLAKKHTLLLDPALLDADD